MNKNQPDQNQPDQNQPDQNQPDQNQLKEILNFWSKTLAFVIILGFFIITGLLAQKYPFFNLVFYGLSIVYTFILIGNIVLIFSINQDNLEIIKKQFCDIDYTDFFSVYYQILKLLIFTVLLYFGYFYTGFVYIACAIMRMIFQIKIYGSKENNQ